MRQPETAGHLLHDLDGEVVAVGDEAWRIALYGVRFVEGRQWVQLVLVGEPMFSLTLRLPHDADERAVLCLLAGWLVQPEDYVDFVVRSNRIEHRRMDLAPPVLLPRAAWSSQLQ